jgi:hypothetical protein
LLQQRLLSTELIADYVTAHLHAVMQQRKLNGDYNNLAYVVSLELHVANANSCIQYDKQTKQAS